MKLGIVTKLALLILLLCAGAFGQQKFNLNQINGGSTAGCLQTNSSGVLSVTACGITAATTASGSGLTNSITGGNLTLSLITSCLDQQGLLWSATPQTWGCASPGTVTSVSVGDLSPLFDASVAGGSSAASITFSLLDANANTVFGNSNVSTSAPPGYTSNPSILSLNINAPGTSTTPSTFTAANYGGSPITGGSGASGCCSGVFNITDVGVSGDTTTNLYINTANGSSHQPFTVAVTTSGSTFTQLQVCNGGNTNVGITVVGNILPCLPNTYGGGVGTGYPGLPSFTAGLGGVAKLTVMDGTSNHTPLRLWNNNPGGNLADLFQMNTPSAASTTFNFFTACTGATGYSFGSATQNGNGRCGNGVDYTTPGTIVASLRGDGTYLGVGASYNGTGYGLMALGGSTTPASLTGLTTGYMGFLGPSSVPGSSVFFQLPATGPGSSNQVLLCGAAVSNISTCSWGSPGGVPSFPVTVGGTVNSGGIPCFNSTTNEETSATILANVPILGGGSGNCVQAAANITMASGEIVLGNPANTVSGAVELKGSTSGNIVIQTNATASLIELGANAQVSSVGVSEAAGFVSYDTIFTVGDSCTASNTFGGATAGHFSSSNGGSPCTTFSITMGGGITAPTGWDCHTQDVTHNTAVIVITSTNTVSETFAITSASNNDIITFSCIGY